MSVPAAAQEPTAAQEISANPSEIPYGTVMSVRQTPSFSSNTKLGPPGDSPVKTPAAAQLPALTHEIEVITSGPVFSKPGTAIAVPQSVVDPKAVALIAP